MSGASSAAGWEAGWPAVLYVAVLALLLPFGAHRLRLLWLRLRRPPRTESPTWRGPLPRVTVQLPVYNEANVIERLIDAACELDYPRDRLEIQVLDDSDDETAALAAERARSWRARGLRIRHIRRGSRSGFKAGALAHGVARAEGEFFLVLDADFVPGPDLIHRLLPPFADGRVGAVQAAWDHLESDGSWLARAQKLFLDAHFAIEHEARYRAGLFFNFNGSGGMWRRRTIEDAGGWQSDTLTEDVDLSYRAQLRGWRFAYLDDVRVPAELPRTLRAVEIQQSRWT
ncbi:MAG: glycosyltransferase, partial [Gemmatimonadota bacterium]|nr:glycosyltransferase [Gemmatimonadota bacterium]